MYPIGGTFVEYKIACNREQLTVLWLIDTLKNGSIHEAIRLIRFLFSRNTETSHFLRQLRSSFYVNRLFVNFERVTGSSIMLKYFVTYLVEFPLKYKMIFST